MLPWPVVKWNEVLFTSDSLRLHGLWLARLLCPWDFPGKNTGMGCHFLLQGIFPTQGSNVRLLHCSWMLYCWDSREAHKAPGYMHLCLISYNHHNHSLRLSTRIITSWEILKVTYRSYKVTSSRQPSWEVWNWDPNPCWLQSPYSKPFLSHEY